MVDFRYHVVSIVAVFLALALGLFLGSTTLQGTVSSSLKRQADSVTRSNHQLEQQLATADTQLSRGQRFDSAVTPYAVAGRLAGQTVALVSAPGVSDADRRALTTTLQEAGATVLSDIRLSASYLDPSQSTELGALAVELSRPASLRHGTGAQQADGVLTDALVTSSGHIAVPRERLQQSLRALADGHFLSVEGNLPERPATTALLLVSGPNAATDPTVAQEQDATLLSLATDLDRRAAGAALAGPTVTAASAGGVLAAARADSTFSRGVPTVDGVDTPAGLIAAVFALAREIGGTALATGPAAATPLPSPGS